MNPPRGATGVAVLVTILVGLAFVVVGCGGGLEMTGGGPGNFHESSGTITLDEGDVVDFTYSASAVEDGFSSIAVYAVSPDGESNELATTTGDETNSVSFNWKLPGEYHLEVSGRNAAYSLTFEKQ